MVLEPTTPRLILALAAATLCSLSGCSATPDESPIELGQVQQAVCVGPTDGSIAVYVSPEGNDAAAGTCNAPLATLEGANRWLRARYGYDTTRSSSGDYSDDCQLSEGHTIYVRGGTFSDQFVNWDCTSPGKLTRIIAYPGERPVFDGLGNQRYAFLLDKPENTFVELNGITWRHYVSFVIQVRLHRSDLGRAREAPRWGGRQSHQHRRELRGYSAV